MSEASETLHLWGATPSRVRELALTCGVMGRILGSNGRWTSFVPIEDDEVERFAAAWPGLTMRWLYFEDFGLGLDFWEAGSPIGGLKFSWHASQADAATPGLVQRLRSKGVIESIGPLQELARGVLTGVNSPTVVRDRAAALLELPAYEWLSPRYSREMSIEQLVRLLPDARDVEESS